MIPRALLHGIAKLETAYRKTYTEAERVLISEDFGHRSAEDWAGIVVYAITTFPHRLPTVAELWQLSAEYTRWCLMREGVEGVDQPAWKRMLDDAGL